jgi:thiamine pyrophosphokinase
MHIVIIANGEFINDARLNEVWRAADLRVAADGGAVNARKYLAYPPEVVVGDLDSIDEATRAWCTHAEFIQHPREKDETDLELALGLARQRGADAITVLGVLGGRFDQMMANVLLMAKLAREKISAHLASVNCDAWVAWEHAEIAGQIGDTVSLIPLTDAVEGIQTINLKYPLRNETLHFGFARGVSNELVAERAVVTFASGLLLVVHLHST